MPDNTQSVVVREVCQAVVDKYLYEVMTCPLLQKDGVQYLRSSLRSGISHMQVVLWMGSILPASVHQRVALSITTTRASIPSC